jgi:type I restriction enzyme S subunit
MSATTSRGLGMSGEWRESTLVDVSDEVAYGYTESATLERVGPRFLRITDIQSGFVDWHTVPYCPITDSDRQKYRLQSGDIVVARTGNSTGENYLYRGGEEAVFASYLIRYRINQTLADPEFIWYNLRTQRWWEFIEGAKTGSAQAGANARILGQFSIPLPPLPEQRRIAKILGDLDDKIELNRKMNETLEQMARALFKSWFIDFDPVRAKMEGRQPPGMDADTAALFPSRLVESELGLIPEGWEVGSVRDSFNLTMGQSPPGDTYNEMGQGIAFYQGRSDFGFRFPGRRMFCTAPTRFAEPGDTLVSVRAPVGDINMANELCCIGRGLAAVRHTSGAKSYTYHAMASLYPEFAAYEAEGTVFGSINKQNFENLSCVMPPTRIVEAYDNLASQLDDQIQNFEHQSRTLASLRDTLLPKLMRGGRQSK